MIAEVLLVLAGHSSSLFTDSLNQPDTEKTGAPGPSSIHPSFLPLLHPGEQQCLESLATTARRYRTVKATCARLTRANPPSRYISALCATLNQILRDEYESLVVETEARVLKRDPGLVARGSFVPLSSIRAVFSEWDSVFIALESLMSQIEENLPWAPGSLIDLLLARANTGLHHSAAIFSALATAVQRVFLAQLTAFLTHGSLPSTDPLATASADSPTDTNDLAIPPNALPSCVSAQARNAIEYAGRAICTVKQKRWRVQPPRSMAAAHARLLAGVLPSDRLKFDAVLEKIREDVSEWLWANVLTQRDVEEAIDSLANYFLLRNGEFSLSMIREIERLKVSRLTSKRGASALIREQDLNLALLRASLGTTAQHDPTLSRLRFRMPTGPLRPLLPSLSSTAVPTTSTVVEDDNQPATFDDLLLGTALTLTYATPWPLDLLLTPPSLSSYAALYAFISALRRAHTRIHGAWSALSGAQRARRRWTGLGEGGGGSEGHEDVERKARESLLRCTWGVVRDMGWFLDTVLAYVMTDVIDVEFRRLKTQLAREDPAPAPSSARATPAEETSARERANSTATSGPAKGSGAPAARMDFSTLRMLHASYLSRIHAGCLLAAPGLAPLLRALLAVCERLSAQIERWGGDVLPELLGEGRLGVDGGGVGEVVRERWAVVKEINETLHTLLDSFYENLSISTSAQPGTAAGHSRDASKSGLLNATVNATLNAAANVSALGRRGAEVEVRRHVERLLLRLDFNGGFSTGRWRARGMTPSASEDILKEGGL